MKEIKLAVNIYGSVKFLLLLNVLVGNETFLTNSTFYTGVECFHTLSKGKVLNAVSHARDFAHVEEPSGGQN